MRLARPARITAGAVAAVLLFGLLGLAWWSWRHRAGQQPAPRFPRASAALVAVGLTIVAIGAIGRLAVAVQSVAGCSPPGGAQAASGLDAAVVAEKAATWPETGLGLLYSRANGAHICWSRSANYYIGVHTDNIAGARAMNLGDIVLSPGFKIPREHLTTLAGHEARHRAQWAVGTVIGGPFLFPVAYAIDDFFFPGSRNHFERQAGLESGGYSHVGKGPVLGAAQLAALGLLVVVGVVGVLIARRRAGARAPAPDPASRR